MTNLDPGQFQKKFPASARAISYMISCNTGGDIMLFSTLSPKVQELAAHAELTLLRMEKDRNPRVPGQREYKYENAMHVMADGEHDDMIALVKQYGQGGEHVAELLGYVFNRLL